MVINNAAVPMRRHVTRLTMAEVERTMRINYFSPVAITLAVLPRMLERGSGTIVNVSSLGGRLGIATEAAYSGSKFALAGWSESMAIDLDRHRGHREARAARRHRHRDLGPARQRRAPLRRAEGAARSRSPVGIVDAIDSDRFEHYLPDMKAVVEIKTTDIDAFMVGMRGLDRRGRRVKALLFGAPPAKDEVRPTPEDELEATLAGIPFGLHEIDDARLVRPDWVVTRPILSGICGSDAKLVLGDFNTGDIDNPMAAFSSLPHVPGPRGGRRGGGARPRGAGPRRRPAGGAQPLADLRPARHRPALPAVPGRRPEPVLELHQGRPRAGRARRGDHRRPRGLGRAAGRHTTPC